jgi:hypothetical protein
MIAFRRLVPNVESNLDKYVNAMLMNENSREATKQVVPGFGPGTITKTTAMNEKILRLC